MLKTILAFTVILIAGSISASAGADTGKKFRAILGFEISSHIPIAKIQESLGPAKFFQSGEFDKAICYTRGNTVILFTSFQPDDGTPARDTFDMLEISTAESGQDQLCSTLPARIPDSAIHLAGVKPGISVEQFRAAVGAKPSDEQETGAKGERVFQKFFSPAHYIYAAFNADGLYDVRVQ
jgi:hypothetical protein